jgi:hypothetical protein
MRRLKDAGAIHKPYIYSLLPPPSLPLSVSIHIWFNDGGRRDKKEEEEEEEGA